MMKPGCDILTSSQKVNQTPQTPPSKKAKFNKGKHMFIFFKDRNGVILQYRVPDGQYYWKDKSHFSLLQLNNFEEVN